MSRSNLSSLKWTVIPVLFLFLVCTPVIAVVTETRPTKFQVPLSGRFKTEKCGCECFPEGRHANQECRRRQRTEKGRDCTVMSCKLIDGTAGWRCCIEPSPSPVAERSNREGLPSRNTGKPGPRRPTRSQSPVDGNEELGPDRDTFPSPEP